MGKTRRQRTRFAGKSNPVGLSDEVINGEELDFGDELNSSVGPIEAARDQLQNANIEEKLNGLQALAVLASSKEKVQAICGTDIVRIAAPLLCEKDNAVRNAAAGALRNLSVCGSDVADYLVEQDVLTPLLVLLDEYIKDAQWIPSFDESMGDQIDLRSDVFLQAINLLWNLCESSDQALDMFNQTSLVEGLLRCLDFKIYGLDIAISVAQCLLVVSENNPKTWPCLNQQVNVLIYLLSVSEEYGHGYLCTLAAGILANVPALAAAYAPTIIESLSQTLVLNHQQILGHANCLQNGESREANNQNGAEIEIMDTEEETEEAAALRRRRQELPTENDIAIRNVGYLLDAQRVAAEVLTNLCSTEDDEWSDAGDDMDSESESVVDDFETNKSNSSTNLHSGDKLSVDIVEAIRSKALIEKLWQRAQPLSDTVVQLLRKSSMDLLMKSKNLRISSLICLQNLCNSLNAEDLGGADGIYNVWVELGQQVFKGAADPSILEPSTSLMRAALDHLKKHKELFSQMTENDLQLMLNGVQNCSMAEIRANWLRMLGTLGCLLPETLVKIIITFILQTCGKEEDVWTISEALDALMDMFADNDWPQIVVELNLPELISNLEKLFKSKVRQQRRELKDRYPAVQTVRTNFTRFVKYIESESAKYTTNGTK